MEQQLAFSQGEQQVLASALGKMTQMLRGGSAQDDPRVNAPQRVDAQTRTAIMQKLARKEMAVVRALQTTGGLRRIAANMANPVREVLDYRAIARNFVVVEQIPDGVPLLYDKDLPRVPALKIGPDGAVRLVEMKGTRVEIKEFEIAARPYVPYKELYIRRFRALDRAKDRLIEGLELREDLIWFSLFEAASNIVNPVTTVVGTRWEKQDLASAFYQVERHRLVVTGVLMSAFGTKSIRSWQFQNLDQAGMQAVRETGYLGNMWGADFYVSDQLPAQTAYILAQPKFLGWMPIRKDAEVIPADDPANLRLGFVGYQLQGMTLFNPRGIAKLVVV